MLFTGEKIIKYCFSINIPGKRNRIDSADVTTELRFGNVARINLKYLDLMDRYGAVNACNWEIARRTN